MDVREKLVELLNEVQETGVNEIPSGFGCTREYIANEKVASHLIANVAPVVHGRWLCVDTDTEKFFLCNRCKKKEYLKSNYCPNCGAKMDGD